MSIKDALKKKVQDPTPKWRFIMKMIALLTAIAAITCSYMFSCTEMMDKYGVDHDAPVEQALEQFIAHETGIIVDFSEEQTDEMP